MRGAPQVGFSATIRKIRARTSLADTFPPSYSSDSSLLDASSRRFGEYQDERLPPPRPERSQRNPKQLCAGVNQVRGRCECKASSCRRRAKFSRTRPSRERKELTIHPEEMPERNHHGKNIIGTIRIQLCAKSFILQVYDVLARHSLLVLNQPGI